MNDNKPVIAVDFDDTLMNFAEYFTDFHNRYYGTNVNINHISDHGKFHEFFDCERSVISERLVHFDEVHDYTELSPIDGTQLVIEQLSTEFSLQIVTARQGHEGSPLPSYLDHFFGKGIFSKVHFTNFYKINSSWQDFVRTKKEICEEIGAVAMIEDAPSHAKSVAESGIMVLMLDRPWNKDFKHSLVTRFNHWKEVPVLVK